MRTRVTLPLALAAVAALAACSRDSDPTGPASSPTEARVFVDDFIAADFQAFAGSKLDAVQLDNVERFTGTTSLRVTIPAPTDPTGGFAGGAFVASVPRNLTQYNALTFYAKASAAATLNVAGLGNDNTGNSQYIADRFAIPITTAWQKIVLPIPQASRLSAEQGLLYFAEGAEDDVGYTLWLDDIRFETLPGLATPTAALTPTVINAEVGATQQLGNIPVTYSIGGSNVTMSAMPGYFSFASNNPSVATVADGGLVTVVAEGSAEITATLGSTPVTGAVTIAASSPPAAAATEPTRDAADVISLFSDAYTNRTVDTWSAPWDNADVSDVTIGGSAVKRYANFVFAGIEFTSNPVNASTMTHVHFDVYVSNATSFSFKLVDFGANGTFGGGDDTEGEVVFTPASMPALTSGAWNSFDVPLSAFTGLTGRSNLAQIIIVGSSATTYLDNVYFYAVQVPTAPETAAPTPTADPADVISLFSNAYTNNTVDTWSAVWDNADVADTLIAGNDVKKYTNFVFAGIEFGSATVNATAMTHFNMDIWTPDPTDLPTDFRITIVDFGADNAFGGGDDSEHQLVLTAATTPALATGSWATLSIPLSDFTGLTARANLAQIVIVSGPNTVFVDNVYFSNNTP